MRRWTWAGLFVLVSSVMICEARGDLIGPRRPGVPVRPGVNPFAQPGAGRPAPVKVKLVVKVDEKAKLPVLQVPINLALGRQANAGVGQGPEADPESGRRFGLSTVVAGLALTLAFASGGLWLVRSGSGRKMAIFVVAGLFVAGAAAFADLTPHPAAPRSRPQAPPAKPALTTLKLPAGIDLNDKLILEPMPPGDHLTLIVPKSMVLEKEKQDKEKAAASLEKDHR